MNDASSSSVNLRAARRKAADLRNSLTVAEWAARISDAWQRGVTSIFETGRALIEAKRALPHGEFEAMIASQLPFGARTAQRLMAIAAHPVLSNTTHASLLPPSWMTLYELSRLDDRDFARLKREDVIRPEMKRSDLMDARRRWVAESKRRSLRDPSGTFRVLYADPPWDYGAHKQPDYYGEQRDHYPVMELDEICALKIGGRPVADIVDDDAVLFLWVTSPIALKAAAVIAAWGFEYKASFVWDKIKHVMGHYNSVRHELLLICTRGACRPDVKQLFDSVQSIERGKHSAKPVEFYTIIETLYTWGRKLELFHRGTPRAGWEAHGYESLHDDAPTSPTTTG